MARKAKKKLYKMPKLSFVDQCIYWIILAILAFLWVGMVVGAILLRKQIAFADEMVVAARERASSLWSLISWFVFFVTTFALWITPYLNRQPIFGLRNFKYGPPAWPKVYPIFMKNKPHVWVSEKQKQNKKKNAVGLVIVLLVSMMLFPLSLYGRECLLSDGSVRRYNMFNRVVYECPAGQIDSVIFATDFYTSGKYSSYHWGVDMTLSTEDGRTFYFDNRSFQNSAKEGNAPWISDMLEVKTRYLQDIISYDGIEDIEKVVEDKHLTEQEIQKLYRLFEITE